jgi:hypothetical protein
MSDESPDLSEAIARAASLSLLDRVRLIERVVATLEHDLAPGPGSSQHQKIAASAPTPESDGGILPGREAFQARGWDLFGAAPSIEMLANQQSVNPAAPFDDLLGDFWSEDDSVDDFLAAVRQWRREGE